MSRDAQIPILLWITAAIVVHMAGGEGAATVSRVYQDRANLRAIVHNVRSTFSKQGNDTIEVLAITEPTPPEEQVEPPKDTADGDQTDVDRMDADPSEKHDAVKPKKAPEKKAEEKKPEEKKPEEQKKPEPEKVVVVPPVVAPPPPPPPPMAPDHRLAIRQHADPNQADNPNANRIADEANHVAEETMAKIRAHDQDAQSPQIGSKQLSKGPDDKEGNADDDKEADSEQHQGDKDHAPGESDKKSTSAEHDAPKPPSDAKIAQRAEAPSTPGDGARGTGGKNTPNAPVPPAPREGGAGPSSPEVIAGTNGGYTVDPANPGGDGKGKTASRKRAGVAYQSPVNIGGFGYGKGGPLNLAQPTFEKAIGEKQLQAERMADGAARLSRHRGSAPQNKFGEYKAAIENYDPSVKPGNQTALNAARSVFATYLNTIHNRIHPIFADEFLSSLDAASKSNVMNKPDLWTRVEIVLSKDQGKIVRFGIVKPSGVTAFDIVALNSIKRAEPFGKAPDAIVSPDGNVYLHWEFHRDPFDACSTRNARPFLIAGSAASVSPVPGKSGKAGSTPSSDAPRVLPPPLLPLK